MGVDKKDSQLPDYARVERHEMMRGVGYGDTAIDRLQIGVVSSWGEVNPASIHLDRVVAAVKDGVWAAGGTPRPALEAVDHCAIGLGRYCPGSHICSMAEYVEPAALYHPIAYP